MRKEKKEKEVERELHLIFFLSHSVRLHRWYSKQRKIFLGLGNRNLEQDKNLIEIEKEEETEKRTVLGD